MAFATRPVIAASTTRPSTYNRRSGGRDRPVRRGDKCSASDPRRHPRSAVRPRSGSPGTARVRTGDRWREVPDPLLRPALRIPTGNLGRRPWGSSRWYTSADAHIALTRCFAKNGGGSSRVRSYPHALSRENAGKSCRRGDFDTGFSGSNPIQPGKSHPPWLPGGDRPSADGHVGLLSSPPTVPLA
jgi:hypothetical protein